MKNRSAVFGISALLLGISLFGGLLHHKNTVSAKSSLVVQPIDSNGIFIGEKQKITKDASNSAHDYWKQVKAIDEASAYESLGDIYFRSGDFEKAAEEYKKAYSIGDKAVSGFLLAKTYEKLGRHKEGIALLDQMIQNSELSTKGIKNANEIKSRLLAAKAQANQS